MNKTQKRENLSLQIYRIMHLYYLYYVHKWFLTPLFRVGFIEDPSATSSQVFLHMQMKV